MAYTTINKSSDYFNTKLYTGNGGTQSITGVGFQPDLVYTTSRSNAYNNGMFDNVRGVNKLLNSNTTNAEASISTGISSFDSDGFTFSGDAYNTSGYTFVGWNWKANGSGSANTVGSISSTVSANTTSGFSIVTFTGTGSAATVGHGLGAIPKMIIIKSLSGGTSDWIVYHNSIGNGKALKLNSTVSPSADAGYFNSTTPTSTVFSLGVDGFSNGSGQPMIAYCFSDVQGYSKCGSYKGNGNDDGTFVYTGFKPAFFMVKRTDLGSNWTLFDNKRANSFNEITACLEPNTSNAEQNNNTYNDVDFVSNGIKIREGNGDLNNNGSIIIYMAFAEAPLVGTNGVTAKAR